MQEPELHSPRRLSIARRGVFITFFIPGFLFANWAARIPQIQDNLQLSEGALGFALLGLSLGAIFGLTVIGGFIARFGSHRMSALWLLLLCLALPLLALAWNFITLFVALFTFGTLLSLLDVSMNAQGVAVERLLGRSIMGSLHAAYSVGAFVGALLGGFLAGLAWLPLTHFLLVTAVAVAVSWGIRGTFIKAVGEDEGATGTVFQLPQRQVWPIGAVAFCAMLAEGSMADWSAIYLRDIVGSNEAFAAYGFAAFNLMMTVGRFGSDVLANRIAPSAMVRGGGLIATAGLLIALLWPTLPVTFVGFGLVGIGISYIVPLAFSAGGNLPNTSPGVGIAGVSTIGYAAFLAGPPVIGLIAEATSLRFAFIIVLACVALLVHLGGSLTRADIPADAPLEAVPHA